MVVYHQYLYKGLYIYSEHKFLLRGNDEYKHEPLDVSDMMQTFWRLITNPTLMCNNLASVFYFLGYMPYWVFMAKYIETQYRQSASASSLVTGELMVLHSLRILALVNSKLTFYTLQLFPSFLLYIPLQHHVFSQPCTRNPNSVQ
jgi:hypothetical protein